MHMRPSIFRFLLLNLYCGCATLLALGAGQAQAQVTARQAELKAAAMADARTIGTLPAQAALTIATRKGFWVQVASGSLAGWLRVSDIQFVQPGNARVNLAALDSGRLGKGNIVATSAARGLSAKDLQDAAPDVAAVQALVSQSRDAALLAAFRAEGGLHARTIAPLKPAALQAGPVRPAVLVTQKPATGSPSDAKDKNEDW